MDAGLYRIRVMFRRSIVASLLALATPVHAADLALPIDIRRLDVMMDQVRDIETALNLSPPPERPARTEPFDQLLLAVDEYNDLRPVACAAHLVEARYCSGPWLPAWVRPADDAVLRSLTDEAAERLTPFWQAVCAGAPKPAAGEPVCPME
jgi:hypothetical protein